MVSNLKFLDLSNNIILIFDPMAFHGLQRLETLNLSANDFTPSVFKQQLFEPLVKLKLLEILRYRLRDGDWSQLDSAFEKL